ncbi:hypothetical protein R6Q59_004458 [Mikania micrantha]|uniref:MYND-type domain-containing protein n=1 Tax=Mikania micrantha TaxID=192012 RepID=A0A5N6LCM4_9ASTR|nr:hypothetical protein E3N88_45739 [Mikania micrantha]KAD0468666.1 hypothetical protein E3N88_44220 [Mikania micrantha]
MRTRRGNSYPMIGAQATNNRKKSRLSTVLCNFFDMLPDDIVLFVLVKLASTADCPADFVGALLTCRRFNGLGLNSLVLSQASAETFAVKATRWTQAAYRFLQRCTDAGNVEACYTLGMIQFYCFQNRRNGAALMAKAAIRSHATALYSLAIIQFNGSGGSKDIKDLIGGVTLCARAAFLGHIDALRELGHCLKDGYGIGKNTVEGQRFLLEANARELSAICSSPSPALIPGRRLNLPPFSRPNGPSGSTLGEIGFCLPFQKIHPANRFLAGWYAEHRSDPAYRICSYSGCGRPETRIHEFRRCAVCGVMNYCSRGCQARDWTVGHSQNCQPMVRFPGIDAGGR